MTFIPDDQVPDFPRMTTAQLARVLNCSQRQAERQVKAGLGPGYYRALPGSAAGEYVIPVEAVARYMRGEVTPWSGSDAMTTARELGAACAHEFLRSFGVTLAASAGEPMTTPVALDSRRDFRVKVGS